MKPAAAPATLDEDDLQRFQDFFYRQTGIVFGPAKRYFVERRLLDRIAASGQPSLRAYLLHLRYADKGEEMQNLVNIMTVNETYFYRETYQFQSLTREILPEIVARRRGAPVSIWSLPCSTGEEPYSIAIWLLENWPQVDAQDVSIEGSDIDTRVLSHARAGIYDTRSVQNLSPAVLDKYFEPVGNGRWRLIAALRSSVEFSLVNLSDRARMRQKRDLDVIFCRNLLIYFDDTSRREAAEALFDALRPGGFLLLGHSESMSRISGLFTVRKLADGIVYQKPL